MDLFTTADYRVFLRAVFPPKGENRGKRTALAQALDCQTSFISQVLTNRAHLSLEHAIKAARFLKLTKAEQRFFILLVQRDKAGSRELARHFEDELKAMRAARREVTHRIDVDTQLSAEDQMKYYSAWYYSVIHVCCALPGLNQPAAMAAHLRLDLALVRDALRFLEERGFVQQKRGTYSMSARRIHLAKGSAMVPSYHRSFRHKAIDAVDFEREHDLHYTGILGIARSDVPVFKEELLKFLARMEKLLQNSREEVPVALMLDLFEI